MFVVAVGFSGSIFSFYYSSQAHMAITRQKKVAIIDRLDAALAASETVVFANFHGLTVAEVSELRAKLRSEGVSYYVAKKSLVRRSLETAGVTGVLPELKGEIAVVYSKDPIAPAKGIAEYAKTHKEHLKLVGGVYQGAFLSASEAIALATIPPREVLLGMLVNVLSAPVTGFVRTLNNTIGSLVQVLHQIEEQKTA